jgi:hypothetical protein
LIRDGVGSKLDHNGAGAPSGVPMAIRYPHSAGARAADRAFAGPIEARPDPTDYAHRDFVNLVAAAFLLLIAVAIVWTVRAMEDYERLQNCFDSGRRDCVVIAAPHYATARSHVH